MRFYDAKGGSEYRGRHDWNRLERAATLTGADGRILLDVSNAGGGNQALAYLTPEDAEGLAALLVEAAGDARREMAAESGS